MPTVSTNDIVSQMRGVLAVTEPDLDTNVGSTVRKMLDAFGEVIAEGYADRYLLDYQYDIEAKFGTDLDEFVKLFGFTRLPAKRATGTVTFARTSSTAPNVVVPFGTQVATPTGVVFSTIVPAIIVTDEISVDVPVQAVLGGVRGNVSAHTVSRRITPIEGVSSFDNGSAMINGTDAESDDELRHRFKRTIFRNLAGTEQMFLGVALDDPDVSQANVIGASKRYREQVEVVAQTAQSVIVGAKYVYPNSSIVGVSIDGGDLLTPNVHYTFDDTTTNLDGDFAPTITIIDAVVAPDGIYELEFEYLPKASRNDPENGVTNRVDVYVNGVRATEATETAVFRTARLFNNTTSDPLYRQNFRRSDDTVPQNGNYFVQLAFTPVLDPAIANTIVIGVNTYTQDTDFFLVNDVTENGQTPHSMGGIEWVSAANGGTNIPANLTAFTANYTFNAVPSDVETAVRAWRLITTDARVHQARPILLDIHLVVILSPGYSVTLLEPDIEAAVADYIDGVGFDGVVQVSDILEVVHGVQGVDAVRFSTDDDDAVEYAIQRVSGTGSILETYATSTGSPFRAVDVVIGDDRVAALNDVTLVVKAENTFGAV